MKRIILIFLILICSVLSYADEIIVARVNSSDLTMANLETEVDRLIPQMTYHKDIAPEKRKSFYPKALEELIVRELQYQDAMAKGIKPDKDKIDAQMEQVRKRFKSKKDFKKYLERKGTDEEQLKQRITRDILIQTVYNETITKPSQFTEAELREYFEKNTRRFKQPETVKLRIISTSDEKKAHDIQEKIKAGADFAEIASTMSEDSYRVKGGDIGYVHKGRMIPEFEESAFKLKAGEVSDLIKAEGTWFILKVEDSKPEHLMSFDEVRDRLKQELETKRLRDLKDTWITNLRAKAKIEVFLKTEPSEGEKTPSPAHKHGLK
jgi:peptidyl-prolyl cis-trans isomerase C